MSSNSEFFPPKNNILRSEREARKKVDEENKFLRCAECNALLGAVSITLYEIEEKHYCSKCYSRKIIALAVERDHFDIKREKEARQK